MCYSMHTSYSSASSICALGIQRGQSRLERQRCLLLAALNPAHNDSSIRRTCQTTECCSSSSSSSSCVAALFSIASGLEGCVFVTAAIKRGRSQHIEEPNSKPPTPLLRVQKVAAQLIAPSVASNTVASSRKSKNSPLHLQCSSWSDVLLRAYLSSQPWCADLLQAKTSTTKLFSSLRGDDVLISQGPPRLTASTVQS
jgi:hypothetical protein